VTDVGESREIVGECGIVVPPGDPGALAEGLERALALGREERARIGKLARQRITDRYDLAAITRRYQEVYLDAANRR